uniref:Uncharacterized protein n=1 Tax=Chenopodium quinoa TaxID=63459 RepID=A0A803M0C8_CHEQI
MVMHGPDAQLSSLEIASQLTTTNPDAAVVLDRLLRILANFTIVTFSNRVGPNGQVERVYGLGPVCQFLVKNGGGGSYSAFATLMYDKVVMNSWKHLKDAVLDGGVPFNLAHGMGVFDYLGTNSRFYNVFYDGMDHHSIMVSKKILDNYKGFEGISSLVDVGGATGVTLNMIIPKYPSIKGINFDLPHIIKDAPSFPGIEHVGGDMYINVPKGDAIFMKIFYLDRLNRNPVRWDMFPRVKVWSMKQIRMASKDDRRNSGDFGKLGMVDIAYGERHFRTARDAEAPHGNIGVKDVAKMIMAARLRERKPRLGPSRKRRCSDMEQ